MKKITIIGAGNLGISLALGLKNLNYEILLTCASESTKEKISQKFHFSVSIDNILSIKTADIIILAVQPKQAEQVLLEIKDSLCKNQIFISVVTGLGLSKIKENLLIGKIYRAMPNTASSVKSSMTAITNGYDVKIVIDVFKNIGGTIIIDESMFPEFTVLSGSGTAIVLKFIRSYMQSGIKAGFSEYDSLKIAKEVILGACLLLKDKNVHPEVLIDAVTTPAGCTIETLLEMEKNGFQSALATSINIGIEKARKI